MQKREFSTRGEYTIPIDVDGRHAVISVPIPVTDRDLKRVERWAQKFRALLQIWEDEDAEE